MKQDYFEIGQIVNTFGIKGTVKVNPYTDDDTIFERLDEILIEKNKQLKSFKIEEVKYSKNQILLKLKGINTIEEANLYRNCYIKILRKQEDELPENTYFIADLIGIKVYSDEGNLLGILDDVYNTGANDIYVVKDEFGKTILLPAIEDVIKEINLEEEKIIVHILNGLI